MIIISTVDRVVQERDHTSRRFRIAESPPITDLRGGKASEESFTMLMANLVVVYAVEFQLGLFSDPTCGVSSEGFGWFTLRENARLNGSFGANSLAYHWTHDRERSRDRTVTKLMHRSQDLELIPWDVARPDQLHLGLRWG